MTINIEEKDVNGTVYKNLKFSRQTLPAEFVVVEKVYEEPKSGTGQYGNWYNYLFRVKEVKSVDPSTLEITHNKDEVEASFFASEKLHEKIVGITENVPFKIYKETIVGKKGEYSTFAVEMVGEDKKSSESGSEWLDDAKYMLNNGLDKETVAEQIAKDRGIEKTSVLDEINDLPE
jgi:hypothetical protein